MDVPLRYLTEAEARTCLPPVERQVAACRDALAALRHPAHAGASGRSHLPPKVSLDVARGRAFSDAMPAVVEVNHRRLVGMKWISGDPEREAPSIDGLILLEDPERGRIRGLIAASHLTAVRTAAVSLVALEVAPPRTNRVVQGEPWRVTFVGGGVQAFSHREALHAVVPDAHVTFVTRRDARELPCRRGDEVVTPDQRRAAVEGADVVITSAAFGTPDREIDAAWLTPGATVVATDYATCVTPKMLEGVRAANGADGLALVVDDMTQFDAFRQAGKLPGYGTADASLGDLIEDRAARLRLGRDRDEGATVIVNHLGVAACDLALADLVLGEAERRGVGTPLAR